MSLPSLPYVLLTLLILSLCKISNSLTTLTYLKLPTTVPGHLSNLNVLNTLVKRHRQITSTSPTVKPKHNIVIVPSPSHPSPPLSVLSNYLNEVYSTCWDLSFHSPDDDGVPIKETPDICVFPGGRGRNTAGISILEVDPELTTLVGTLDSFGPSSPLGLKSHYEAVNNLRSIKNLPPLSDLVMVEPFEENSSKEGGEIYLDSAVVVQGSGDEGDEGDSGKYKKVVCGGTFDHLHYGHRRLLTVALACTSGKGTLTIGVSGEGLGGKSRGGRIEDVGVRRKKVEEFMARLSPGMRNNVRLTTLDTPYGSTVVERDVEAVVLSSETVRGGREINKIRKGMGWEECDLIVATRGNAGGMSSTGVRRRIMGKG